MRQKFSVVLPTLDRADTLESALRTCVSQEYPNYEIIVSDNASTDHTKAVIDSFQDPRIRYINPGSRLGMSEHWDFALSHVAEGFVTVLGDDDGLLPGAIEEISRLIEATGTDALTWRKAEYCWPQHIVEEYRHYLDIYLGESVQTLDCKDQVRRVLTFSLPYNHLPCIYNSFISLRCINEFKKSNGGRMFTGQSPDVFSGFAIASVLERYALSARPYSINGAGSKSNGTAAVQQGPDNPIFKSHLTDTEYKLEEGLPHDSVEIIILDAFLKVRKITDAFPLSWADDLRIVECALGNAAASTRSDARYEAVVDAIGAFAASRGLQKEFKDSRSRFKRMPNAGRLPRPGLYDNGRLLVLNGFNLRIENVLDAARWVDDVLRLKADHPTTFDKLRATKTPDIAIPMFARARSGPRRIHLGCGSTRLDGYVNVDFPPAVHNVMDVQADLFCDVTKIDLPQDEIDEVRIHHVFEHFNRVVALTLLIRWQGWLRIGGLVRIETPDFEASAADFLGAANLDRKLRAIRHLEGDQAAVWAYHVGQWFPERFTHTLSKLGFADIETRQEASGHIPPLFNVQAIGRKHKVVDMEEQYQSGCDLLRQFTVAEAEQPTLEVWMRQLAGALDMSELPQSATIHPDQKLIPVVRAPVDQEIQSARADSRPPVRPAFTTQAFHVARNAVARFDQRFLNRRLWALKRRLYGHN